MSDLPGGPIASRPLHFIWILDTSSSMEGEKIGQLNFVIKEALPAMRDTAADNPTAQLLLRVVTFSSGARWHVAQATPVDQFTWTDVTADGVTDMGKGLSLVAEQLRMPPMSSRALPPVLVLISDGYPTDNFDAGLKALMAEPWGKRAIRLAVGMGGDTNGVERAGGSSWASGDQAADRQQPGDTRRRQDPVAVDRRRQERQHAAQPPDGRGQRGLRHSDPDAAAAGGRRGSLVVA